MDKLQRYICVCVCVSVCLSLCLYIHKYKETKLGGKMTISRAKLSTLQRRETLEKEIIDEDGNHLHC